MDGHEHVLFCWVGLVWTEWMGGLYYNKLPLTPIFLEIFLLVVSSCLSCPKKSLQPEKTRLTDSFLGQVSFGPHFPL